MYDVVVVGAGASGIMAAIAAARSGCNVCLVEKSSRIGQKILATGNGRCNLSNSAINSAICAGVCEDEKYYLAHSLADAYNNPAFVADVLSKYDYASIIAYFNELGLLTTCDLRGWAYPKTRWANSVLDVLRNAITRFGITVMLKTAITDIIPCNNGGFSALVGNTALNANKIVLATCKAQSYSGLSRLKIMSAQPILGPLQVPAQAIRGLDGVRTDAQILLIRGGSETNSKANSKANNEVFSEVGELHFRKDSLSGIAIFNVSRYAQTGMMLCINLMPELTYDELNELLQKRFRYLSDATMQEFLTGMLHTRLIASVLAYAGLNPDDYISKQCLQQISMALTNFRLPITGLPTFAQAQVTRGGYLTQRFNSATLQSQDYPGLFACGECLDIDGPCGGYNLHWAWASGTVAGMSAGTL
ncbi:MAG: aminoacetone oxidase family FAD-binding enzyme [Coriobacteriales bacterium]|jgi:predicted Rossmann fold flavoprotein|nr:aminoacetone oxidase family FAD-binding enzyme [Coriobacteriales bacterium]